MGTNTLVSRIYSWGYFEPDKGYYDERHKSHAQRKLKESLAPKAPTLRELSRGQSCIVRLGPKGDEIRKAMRIVASLNVPTKRYTMRINSYCDQLTITKIK